MAQFPIDIKINTGEANKLTPLNRELDKTDRSATLATTAVRGLGVAITALGGAAVVTRAIKVNTDFNRSISELSAITGATGRDLQFLTDASKEFGATTTLSASQAATAFKLIASAKPDLLSNVDALKAVTREAIALAEAAGIDLPAAADTLGNALNQFNATADQSSRFINVLAAGAKFGSSSIQDTAAALRDAGVSASTANISFEETNAAIQALATSGLTGSRAGTALRNVITILDTSVNENLRPSVVGLTAALANLDAQGLDTTEFVKLFGRENQNAARILLNQRENLRGLTQALTGTSTAYEQAATRTDNLAGDLLALQSAFEGVQIESAQLADGGLRDVTQAITRVLQGFNENPERISELFSNIGTAVTAVAAIIAGRYVTSISASTAAYVKKTAAVVADTAATRQSAAAAVAAAAAKVTDTKLTLQAATAERQLEVARLQAQITEKGRTASLNRLAAARIAEITATRNATAATVTYTAAVRAQAAAATTTTVAMGGLRAAMVFLGGPVGVALLVAAALFTFAERAETAEERAKRLAGEVDKLGDSFAGLTREELLNREQQALANVFETQKRINDLTERQRQAQLNMKDPSRVTSDPREFEQTIGNARATYERLGQEIEALREKQEKERLLVGQISEERKKATAEMLKQKIAAKELAEAQATEQFEKVRAALQDQVYELKNGARAYELYRAAREAGVELDSKEAAELDELITKRERLAAATTITELEQQLEALKLNNEELAIYNATVSLSTDVTAEQRQQIVDLTSAIYQQNEALAARRAVEQFDESTESPIDKINRQQEEIREANRLWFETALEDERLSQEQRLALIEEYKAREIAITELSEEKKKELRDQFAQGQLNSERQVLGQVLSLTSNTFAQIADTIAAAKGKESAAYKVAFLASKAAAIAQAVLQTELASTAALAPPPVGLGPVAGLPYSNVIRTLGYASVGIMAGQAVSGFKDGGYTGDIGVNDVAGVVHGQEFVMPAFQTKMYRDQLEAMRAGVSPMVDGDIIMPAVSNDQYRSELDAMRRGNHITNTLRIKIINNVSDVADARVEQSPDGELIATIDRRIADQTPGIVASELADPYSESTKSLNSQYRLERQ